MFLRIGIGKGADRREQVVCIAVDIPVDSDGASAQ